MNDTDWNDWVSREQARIAANKPLEAEHTRFQTHYLAAGDSPALFNRDGTGMYRQFGVQALWEAWKASSEQKR